MADPSDGMSSILLSERKKSSDIEWVSATNASSGHLADHAVVGGKEAGDGADLFVMRAEHKGDLIPGKLRIMDSLAWICYNGKEIKVDNIEVLCAPPDAVTWKEGSDGSVPDGAIPGGSSASGETLYICRASHMMSLIPGKLHPSHKTCYMPYGKKEVNSRSYDVLCRI